MMAHDGEGNGLVKVPVMVMKRLGEKFPIVKAIVTEHALPPEGTSQGHQVRKNHGSARRRAQLREERGCPIEVFRRIVNRFQYSLIAGEQLLRVHLGNEV